MELSPKELLYLEALRNVQGQEQLQDASAVLGASGGAVLGGLLGTPVHYFGQKKIKNMDQNDPYYEVTKRNDVGEPIAMNVKGAIPRQDRLRNKVRPGARMAGSLVGALVGGGLGTGVGELVKRESPEARLIAKIQVQGGRLTPNDAEQLENMLASGIQNQLMGG